MDDDVRTGSAPRRRDAAGPAGVGDHGGHGDDVGVETWATLDRWLTYQLWQSRVPGAQVAVGLGGRLLFSRAYGLADVESGTAMTPSHLFHIASQSKTFTATLVLRLVEQGRLQIEDAVGSHVGELAGHEVGDVTLRELLGHTGGLLRDGADASCWQGERPFPDRAELLDLVGTTGKRPPGELFAYSNLGYGLLGAVVEAVTGRPYAEAVAEHVVDRVGLSNTFGRYEPERAGDYATGYSGLHAAAAREPLPHVDTRALDPAAGLTSTAEDLVAYYSAHVLGDDRLLSDRSKRRMHEAHRATDPAQPHGQTYGLGLDAEELDGRRVVGHGGGYPGHTTRAMLDPEDGLVVVAMTNVVAGPANALVSGAMKIVDDARAHPGEPDRATRAAARTGRWASAFGVSDIAVVGHRLLGLDPGAADPVAGADVLELDGTDRLRIVSGSGFGAVGETVTFLADGRMRYGANPMRRCDTLPPR